MKVELDFEMHVLAVLSMLPAVGNSGEAAWKLPIRFEIATRVGMSLWSLLQHIQCLLPRCAGRLHSELAKTWDEHLLVRFRCHQYTRSRSGHAEPVRCSVMTTDGWIGQFFGKNGEIIKGMQQTVVVKMEVDSQFEAANGHSIMALQAEDASMSKRLAMEKAESTDETRQYVLKFEQKA